MKKTLIATTVIAAIAVAGVASAKPGGFFRMGRLLQELELTEAQEDQAIAMKKDIMRETRQMRQSAMESLDDVAVELKKPKPDAARLHSIADQRMDEVKKVVHFAIDRFLTFHGSLDAKQRAELSETLERQQRRAKKWQSE